MSKEFEKLLGGCRTRQLAKLLADKISDKNAKKRAEEILKLCGFEAKKAKKNVTEEAGASDEEKSKMLIYTTFEAIEKMATLLQQGDKKSDEQLAEEFGKLLSEEVAAPDMALSGRMLETGVLKDTTVEAALQVSHAISTHAALPEVDYYVAKDDIPGEDAGAGFVNEAMFASACFYKYFSIDWETLVKNLKGFPGNAEHLAAHTVGAFLRGVALINPTGKQNSFAAHNPPDGMLIELRDNPVSYANAFAKPAEAKEEKRDLVSQSIAQLAQYIYDLDNGYGKPQARFWFSPNLRYPLKIIEQNQEKEISENNIKSLDVLVSETIKAIGFDWKQVQNSIVNQGVGK